MAETSQKTLIDITALKYFYKSLQNVTVLIAPSTVEAASSSNLGHTYFIPADGTYAGVKCDKGDHIVSNGTTWVRIPKGTGSGEGTTYYAGEGIDISKVDDKDVITNTGVTAIEESTADGKINVTVNGESSDVAVHGLNDAAFMSVETELTDDSDDALPTSKAVADYVADVVDGLDVTDEAVDGQYVSAVTEADGKITVIREALPTSLPASDVTDEYDKDGTAPVSGKAVASAISGKLDANQKGANGGVAELDEHGIILSSQLPSYVDDVIEATSKSEFPTTGESGKIYVDTTTNLSYRWGGTDYVEISKSLALGENESTAFRGDHGKAAYDHATTTETNPHGTTKSDVGLGNVDNTSDTDKPISTATQTALDGKVPTTRKVNGKQLNADVTLSGADVAVTGYAKASTASAIAATDTVNVAVGKLEKKVDDKVQKTSVSSSNETTSVINVTDAKAQMAMVAKISGKTYKRNLFDIDTVCATVPGFTKNDAETFNMNNNTNTVMAGFKSNTQYTFSANIKNNVSGGNVRFRIEYTDGTRVDILKNDTNTYMYLTATSSAGKTIMRLICYYGSSGNATVNKFQVEEGTVAHPYVPFGLISTPVESVVSVGKNRFDGVYESGYWDAGKDGSKVASADWKRSKNYIPVNPSTQYYLVYPTALSGSSANGAICFYDASFNYIDYCSVTAVTTNLSYRLAKTTPANCRYITWYQKSTVDITPSISIESTYVPYNKTTVLVPSEARNCVGYGLGISDDICNISDFENGVNTQAVAKKKLKDITSGWGISSTDGYVYCSGITDKKAGLYNIIFSAFSNNPSAAAGSLANGEAKANASNETVYFMDKTCTTVSAFTSKYGESEVVYELKTPVVTPLKDYIRPLPVEQGGTLTLVNEHNLDMPSVIKYKKEV